MARTDRDEAKTHLVARTRNGKDFNRGGLKFSGEYEAWPLADISTAPDENFRWGAEGTGPSRRAKSQLDVILGESQLEARLATAAEVKAMVKVKAAALDANVSKAEMAAYITKLEGRLHDQAERIAALEARLNADKPPTKPADQPPQGPVPPNMQQRNG